MKTNKLFKLLCLALICVMTSVFAIACMGGGEPSSEESKTPTSETTPSASESEQGGEEQATIVLSQTEVVMTQYDIFALSARMSDNSEVTFTWASSAEDIVSVDGGVLTALKEGTATITVSYGGQSVTCAVTVEKSNYYPAMVLSQDTAKVKSGEYITAYADVTFMGQSVSDMPAVTWTADDSSIVKVEQEGTYVKLTALAVGKTNVRATATYRGMALEKVLVFESVTADVYTLLEEEIEIFTFEDGDRKTSYTLTSLLNGETELPDGATVSFASEDEEIASVSADGIVTKEGVGVTKINATYTCGSVVLEDSCIVKVTLTEIELNKTIDIFLDEDDGDQTFAFADLGLESLEYAWSFIDGEEPVAITPTISEGNVTFAFTNEDCGERKVSLLIEGEVRYVANFAVITKVIDTAEELMNITTYGTIANVRNDMPEHGQWWKGPFNYWEQKAYMILGADIVLPQDASFNNRYAYASNGDTLVENGGLIGGFDGRGYTISGGTYNWGGLLGSIKAGSIVKNVAFINANIGGDFSSVIALYNYGTIENVLVGCIKDGAGSVNGGICAVSNGTVRNSVIYWPMPAQTGRNGAVAYVAGATSVTENCVIISDGDLFGATSNGYTVSSVQELALNTVWSDVTLTNGFADFWALTGTKAGFKSFENYMATVYGAIADINMDTGASTSVTLPYLTTYAITSTTAEDMMQFVSYDGATLSIGAEANKGFSFVITLTYNGTEVTEDVTVTVKAPAQKLNKNVDLFLNANDGDKVIEIASDLGLSTVVSESTVYTARFAGSEELLNVTATANGVEVAVTADMFGEKTLILTVDGVEYQFGVTIITKAIKTAEELIEIKSYGIVTDECVVSRDNQPAWRLNGYFVLVNNIDLTGYTVGKPFSMAPWAAAAGGTNWGLIGTFNGRNYTLFGGTYTDGGMFGCVGDGGIVKNVAIVNATLAGDRKGVFAKEMRNCLVENVLVDLVSVNLSNGGAVAYLLGDNAILKNVVVYYPNDATTSNGALANSIKIVAENVYVISNRDYCAGTPTVSGTVVVKAGGTVCAEVGFTGLGDNWVLTGDKALFVSTQAFATEYLKDFAVPTSIGAGESVSLTFAKDIAYSTANFSVEGAEAWVTIANDGTLTVSSDTAEEFTFDVVITAYGVTRTVNVSVDVSITYVNAGTYAFSLYEQQDTTYNFGEGVNGTLKLTVNGSNVELPVENGQITIAYAQVSALLGEYAFELVAGSKIYQGTFIVATKVIYTAEELIEIKSYGTVTDECIVSRDNQPAWRLNGYFALGNNIDLTGYTVGKPFSMAPWAAAAGGTNWGLIGTFNGRNYTLFGGTYTDGGMFGCVGDGGIVKNVAIVNATLAGDRKGVFAKEMRNCLFENVLVDLVSVNISNGGALSYLLSDGLILRNVVVYYPTDSVDTNGAIGNSVKVTAENVYVISDKKISGSSTNVVDGTLVQKAAGTVCAEVGFAGLGDNWVLTGDKAIFVSTQEFLD